MKILFYTGCKCEDFSCVALFILFRSNCFFAVIVHVSRGHYFARRLGFCCLRGCVYFETAVALVCRDHSCKVVTGLMLCFLV